METTKRAQLSEDNIRTILALRHKDITKEWMLQNFGITKTKAKIPMNGEFILQDRDVKDVSLPRIPGGKITTTAGRYVTNLFMLGSSELTKFFEFVNEPWSKKVINRIGERVSKLLIEEKITSTTMVDYIDRQQWFGYAFNSFVNPSLSSKLFRPNAQVQKQFEQDISDNQEAVDRADIQICGDIVIKADKSFKATVENEPSYDWFKSGAAKDVLQVISVTRGLIAESRDNTKFHFVKSNLQDGIEKSEIDQYADNGISSACSRGIETQRGGDLVKMYNAAFSHVELGEKGSDCGTKFTKDVIIDKNAIREYHLRYCYFGGKEYCLTEENIEKLIGKTVKMRSPIFCTDEKICNKCAGDLYFKVGIRNVGFLISKCGSSLLNAFLKSFHNTLVKMKPIDLDKYLTRL